MFSAIAALTHNARLIEQTERVLQEFAESEHCYIYIKNPDGSRLKLQPGCKIESYEFIPMQIEEVDS